MGNWNAIVRSSVIIAKITGSFSIIGSFLLARHILHKRRKQSGRGDSLASILLFNISVVNIIGVFFTFFMGPWMTGVYWDRLTAEVNIAACTAQGFFLYFTEVYFLTAYAGLGALYCLIVRRGWTKHDWEKKRIKAAFLLPPVIVSLAFSVPPLFYQMYNPTPPVMCMLDQYPPYCETEFSDEQCTRGKNALLAQQIELLYALICNLAIIIFMGLLVLSVYRTEKKGDKYLSKGQAKKRDNTIETAWQGVRYGGAITLPFVPLYVFLGVSLRGSYMNDTNSLLVWFYLYIIFTPLLGFNNACVYFYPKYKAHRKRNQDLSIIRCICDTLHVGIPDKIRCCRKESKSDYNTETTESVLDDSPLKEALVDGSTDEINVI